MLRNWLTIFKNTKSRHFRGTIKDSALKLSNRIFPLNFNR